MNVGQNIKNRRKHLGMNAEALAEKLGCSPTTIYRYEKGDIEKIDSARLIMIAEILQTTPAALITGHDEDDESSLTSNRFFKRRKWVKLSEGERVLTDEQLDLIYGIAHQMHPEQFPLDEERKD